LPEIEEKKDDGLLAPNEVWDVLEFANSLTRGVYGYGNAVLTPDLISARLKDISLNPMAATQKELEMALADPKDSEIALQAFAENFELVSQPYKRLISFMANMLSFDLTFSCINAEEGDYKSAGFKKDYKTVENFFSKFDYKKEFNVAVKEMLRNETFIFIPRFDGEQTVLQELPSSPTYTKITGRWDYGFLTSLNMYWFLLPGVSLDFYPPFFKKAYARLWEGVGSPQVYKPTIEPTLRGSSAWVYWQDLAPDMGWCFKLSTELATRVPYFAPMFLDLINQGLMRNLQKNINMSVAARLIMGEIPMLKDTNAKVKDQFSISPTNLGNFLSLVKSAIGDALKTAAVPLNNLQGITFPPVNDLYQTYLNTTLATSGVNTDLIFTGNVRPNLMATQLSLNVDEQLMYTLYPQFEAFLNYFVNKLTKKFKFKFEFEGTKFFNNRQQRFDKQTQLMDRGIVLPNRIAASLGIDPFVFRRELEEGRGYGFVDKLTPIIMASQISKSENSGRPAKEDSDLGDSGGQTRSDGENIGRGGKS
jgi:hypothetical protein